MAKTIAIIQPAFIPWKGYFDIMRRVDEFVLFDDVAYVKRTWYSRNCLKSPAGLKWLSIPVQYSQAAPTAIRDTPVSAPFAADHLNFIAANYRAAPHFTRYYEAFAAQLRAVEAGPGLADVTIPLIRWLARQLGITTPLVLASSLGAGGKATDRLLDICQKRGAARYLSGPAAKAYFEIGKFAAAGIDVDWMDYRGYPDYPQLHPPFEHGVSVLDLLFMTGDAAPDFLRHDLQEQP